MHQASVIITQCHFIIEPIFLSGLRYVGVPLLFQLSRSRPVGSIHHCLNILLTHGNNGLSAVRAYVYRAVAVIDKSVLVGNNLYLCRLPVLVCQGVRVARIERYNTVYTSSRFRCELLADSFRCRHLLRFRVNRLLNAEYGIGRNHFYCSRIRITYDDASVRVITVDASSVWKHYEIAT